MPLEDPEFSLIYEAISLGHALSLSEKWICKVMVLLYKMWCGESIIFPHSKHALTTTIRIVWGNGTGNRIPIPFRSIPFSCIKHVPMLSPNPKSQLVH